MEKPGLKAADYNKILKDALYFFLVPVGFYLTALAGVLQLPNHVFSFNDFIPTNTTIIVIVAWFVNQALSAIRKYVT